MGIKKTLVATHGLRVGPVGVLQAGAGMLPVDGAHVRGQGCALVHVVRLVVDHHARLTHRLGENGAIWDIGRHVLA